MPFLCLPFCYLHLQGIHDQLNTMQQLRAVVVCLLAWLSLLQVRVVEFVRVNYIFICFTNHYILLLLFIINNNESLVNKAEVVTVIGLPKVCLVKYSRQISNPNAPLMLSYKAQDPSSWLLLGGLECIGIPIVVILN